MDIGFVNLAFLVVTAGIFGLCARALRQPLIVAYLATGALAGYLGLFSFIQTDTLRIFSDLGITFLLFLIGLEINYDSLRLVGRASLIIGIGQILFTSIPGYFIARGFNFTSLESLYIAVGLAFSSTIIIVKLISEKREMGSLYGKLSVGFLLVQDAVAIILLIVLGGLEAGQGVSLWLPIFTVLKGLALLAVTVWLGRRIMPRLFDRLAKSDELLFLVSTAWVLLVAVGLEKLGFSLEIGGFLAGVSLASSAERFAISSRIKPLRDFFILIFFVILGSSLSGFNFSGLSYPIIALSLFVLIGNPLVVLVIMGLMGYRKKTGFLAGVTVAQVSEFSLILIALGIKLGHVANNVLALITAVAVITIALSTYMILYADQIAKRLTRFLSLFERKKSIENPTPIGGYSCPIVLAGAHRTGGAIVEHLASRDVLLIDFDPDVVRVYRDCGYECLLGELSDEDILEISNVRGARLVISTSPNFDDNKALLEYINRCGSRAKVIVRAESEFETLALYEAGAHYVIFPHLTSGHLVGKNIAEHPDLAFLAILKENDLSVLGKELL